MTQGIFRGTCARDFYSSLSCIVGQEVVYSPRGDFTYCIVDALSWAYSSSIRRNSPPWMVCLTDMSYIGWANIPTKKLKQIIVASEEGIGGLFDLYVQKEDLIDPIYRLEGTRDDQLTYLMELLSRYRSYTQPKRNI